MAKNYKAQGCLFVGGCVLAGFLLSLATPFDGAAENEAETLLEAPAEGSSTNLVTPNSEAPASAPLRPDWLLGTWAPQGQCGQEGAAFFRFTADGGFEGPEMSGAYEVLDGSIKIHDLQAPADVINEIGGTTGNLEYARDPSSGELKFRGQTVERCSEDG